MMDDKKLALASKTLRKREIPMGELCAAVGISRSMPTVTSSLMGSPVRIRRSGIMGFAAWLIRFAGSC